MLQSHCRRGMALGQLLWQLHIHPGGAVIRALKVGVNSRGCHCTTSPDHLPAKDEVNKEQDAAGLDLPSPQGISPHVQPCYFPLAIAHAHLPDASTTDRVLSSLHPPAAGLEHPHPGAVLLPGLMAPQPG